ncbi:MAG: hypothetical protein ABWY06_16335 [Pseudomonas sp.]|uniref:hypothetical protein n=1 Tax=Pseudomonas sp. TaxID=306 RepID=UPI00339B4A05
MTANTTAASPTAPAAEPVASQPSEAIEPSADAAPDEKPSIAAFTFPFSPAAFAPGKTDGQPWHQKGNKSSHHKTPGRAPNGTRRSMGKR